MKKRILSLFLAALMLFSLAACGENDTNTPNDTTVSPDIPSTDSTEVTADREWLKGKTITIIVGSSAGGNSDVLVRGIIPYWEKTAGCTFVVDNRPGASGQVGYSYFLGLENKGCETITVVTQTFYSNTIVTNGAEYAIDDLAFLNIERMDVPTLTVMEDSPYQTIHELLDAIKANPGEIICGVNTGGASEIFFNVLVEKLGLDVKIVSYTSGSEMRTALMGGHVDFIAGTQAGDLDLGTGKPLVVCSTEKSTIWPDALTVDEIWPELELGNSGLGSVRGLAVDAEDKAAHPERFLALLETYKEAYESAEYQQYLKDIGEAEIAYWFGPDESDRLSQSAHELVAEYANKAG